MSSFGISTSQAMGAGAYARADALGPAIPVRPIDPTRRRFPLKDEVEAQRAQEQARSGNPQADEQSFAPRTEDESRGSRGGFGLLGAFTSFLARMFAQPEGEAAPAATALQAGIQAYARSAGAVSANQDGGVEVLSPSLPRLSSGRALDLTV